MSFSLDIARFVEKTKGKADDTTRRVVSKIFAQVIDKSPVGNTKNWKNQLHLPKGYVGGRFRGNWQVGVDAIPQGVVDRIDPDGGETIAAGIAKIPVKAAGHTYYIVNNLDYAQALEDGHSTQSPPGNIVAGTVAEYQSYIREALNESK